MDIDGSEKKLKGSMHSKYSRMYVMDIKFEAEWRNTEVKQRITK